MNQAIQVFDRRRRQRGSSPRKNQDVTDLMAAACFAQNRFNGKSSPPSEAIVQSAFSPGLLHI